MHISGRGIDILVQSKLQSKAGLSLSALRGHHLQAIDLHELALERRGDVVGNRVRTRARVTDLHLDDGIVHRRQIVHRELKVAQHSKQDY